MIRKILIIALSFFFIPVVTLAKDIKEDKLIKALEKYETTGKIENCIRVRSINHTRVIDDYNIFFIMNGKKAYLNTMKHRCSRLGFEKSFSYKVQTSQLCNVDIITVFDSSGGIQGPSCGLGKFTEYIKKSKVAKE